MKKLTACLLFMIVAGAAIPAFAKRHHDVKVGINKEVEAKGGYTVAFVELIEDSRCPVDVECIWAGNARIKIRVTKNGRSKLFDLNTMERDAVPEYGGYRFRLTALMPELRSNVRINRNAYEATIEMTKVK